MIMGMPMIRDPKNITNVNECAFRIGLDDNDEKSIQEILDSTPQGYSSKDETAKSVRPIFEGVGAMKAYRSGVVLSLRGGDPIGTVLQEYCGNCNFKETCDTSREIYERSGMLLDEAFKLPHVFDAQ